MSLELKEFFIKNKINNPENMNEFEKVKAKILIDFHNQKVIIKYLIKNNFRKVDIYRDANCIPRCIAAKIFKDE